MKLRHVARETPSEANLFEPWERLLLISIELENASPALRALADACFACIRHMAGRETRDDAYRAVRRALLAVKESRGGEQPSQGAPPFPPAAPIAQGLPFDDAMTIRISRESYDALTAYARERELDFEPAVDRLIRTAVRRRRAVNAWNAKANARRGRS